MIFTEEEIKLLRYIVHNIVHGQQAQLTSDLLSKSSVWSKLANKIFNAEAAVQQVPAVTERQRFLAAGYTDREVERLMAALGKR